MIILNYNGTSDTLACIKSIEKYEDLSRITVFLLDNASQEEQTAKLDDSLKDHERLIFNGSLAEAQHFGEWKSGIALIHSSENFGFAKGNNACMRIAVEAGYQYCLLMNNDTELTDSSISKMVALQDASDEYAALSTVIAYWSNPEVLWNAGGKMFFGTRKYYLNKAVDRWKRDKRKVVTVDFLTGCFLLLRSSLLKEYGFLSEDFFFGEEDYEFSLRYAKHKLKMGVLVDTTLLHKVGQSIKKADGMGVLSKQFVHHLNRMIDMKRQYSYPMWFIWRLITAGYIWLGLFRKKTGIRGCNVFIRNLLRFSGVFNGVSQGLFLWVLDHDMTTLIESEEIERIRQNL